MIRFFKGRKIFSASRLPRELKLKLRERSDKFVHLASGSNKESALITPIFFLERSRDRLASLLRSFLKEEKAGNNFKNVIP